MEQDKLAPLQDEAWSGFVRTHALLYRELGRRLVRSHGMPLSTYEVLLRLAWADKTGLRMSDLAQQVDMTSGGLTRLADRLERDGLITRTRSEEDLRGYHARITPAGRRQLRAANRRHLKDVRELFLDNLTSDDLQALADIWRRLNAANDHLTH
ncbi:MarR family transcriptional regulator [Actinomadura fulvescens]|uniref:HTH marR-type domain-containing protein n=1 Tax=Actinomadura fulvescens TaxID=46160 RepID=A0ABP6BV08_9ACTN